jgi:hypothetical protein
MKNPIPNKLADRMKTWGLLAVQAASTLLWLPLGHAAI